MSESQVTWCVYVIKFKLCASNLCQVFNTKWPEMQRRKRQVLIWYSHGAVVLLKSGMAHSTCVLSLLVAGKTTVCGVRKLTWALWRWLSYIKCYNNFTGFTFDIFTILDQLYCLESDHVVMMYGLRRSASGSGGRKQCWPRVIFACSWSWTRPCHAWSELLVLNWKLECGPMPNVMVALPNIGGALCSMPQFGWRPLLDAVQ